MSGTASLSAMKCSVAPGADTTLRPLSREASRTKPSRVFSPSFLVKLGPTTQLPSAGPCRRQKRRPPRTQRSQATRPAATEIPRALQHRSQVHRGSRAAKGERRPEGQHAVGVHHPIPLAPWLRDHAVAPAAISLHEQRPGQRRDRREECHAQSPQPAEEEDRDQAGADPRPDLPHPDHVRVQRSSS